MPNLLEQYLMLPGITENLSVFFARAKLELSILLTRLQNGTNKNLLKVSKFKNFRYQSTLARKHHRIIQSRSVMPLLKWNNNPLAKDSYYKLRRTKLLRGRMFFGENLTKSAKTARQLPLECHASTNRNAYTVHYKYSYLAFFETVSAMFHIHPLFTNLTHFHKVVYPLLLFLQSGFDYKQYITKKIIDKDETCILLCNYITKYSRCV